MNNLLLNNHFYLVLFSFLLMIITRCQLFCTLRQWMMLLLLICMTNLVSHPKIPPNFGKYFFWMRLHGLLFVSMLLLHLIATKQASIPTLQHHLILDLEVKTSARTCNHTLINIAKLIWYWHLFDSEYFFLLISLIFLQKITQFFK